MYLLPLAWGGGVLVAHHTLFLLISSGHHGVVFCIQSVMDELINLDGPFVSGFGVVPVFLLTRIPWAAAVHVAVQCLGLSGR